VDAENLQRTVRAALPISPGTREVRMFGGIGFMLNGNLLLGASERGLLVRVGKDGYRAALARPGAQPMVMRGRTMDGYVRVAPQALEESAVESWVELAIAFVKTLPAKSRSARTRPGSRVRKPPRRRASRS
jgi:TfoX/Sxy family transcriptional regulator of competence genes